ncbi:MAG: BamA/TamA family outer membrane protein [Nitrospinota bacterium]
MTFKARPTMWRLFAWGLVFWLGFGWLGPAPGAETFEAGKLLALRPQGLQKGSMAQQRPLPFLAQFRPPELRRRPELADAVRTKPMLLPLPAFGSSPRKGDDFGLLPVVLFFDKKGEIRNILAPSAIYNTETGLKGAFRWLGFLPNGAKYTLIAIQALDVDSDYIAEFEIPRLGETGRWAASASFRFERDPTKTFFGLGPDSGTEGEAGFTQRQVVTFLSLGINFLGHFRFSYNERFRYVLIEGGGRVLDTFIGDAFPGAAGVGTWTTISARGLSLQYDDRDSGVTPTRGYFGLFGVEFSQTALGSETSFTRVFGEVKAYVPWPSTQWISVARITSSFVDNRNLVHFEQSLLGGKDFRGFPSRRFVDRGIFIVNLEERIRVGRLELLRFPFDLETAPFVEFGQVFNTVGDIELRRIQVSVGLGFRAVVRPNVVGKIDVGAADEGINIRVGVDYPF